MIGNTILDRYNIKSELGHGGMGVVYRAYDSLLKRDVAIKILSEPGLGTKGRVKLLHEAQAAARLNHPNIISIYDAGEVERTAFIIMELIHGKSLYAQRPETLEEIIDIGQQICQALEHAHEHGVIHRDLKPENVILSKDGVAKLTDFGLARSLASRMSTEGAIIGTVFYLPPEQALGKEVDGRTDLYALGVMLYELITGRLPFSADDPISVVSQHLHAPVVPPSTYNPAIPQNLDDLVLQLLNKLPDDRPGSALEVRRALAAISAGGEIQLTRSQPIPIERLARGRLVGREPEIASAKSLWLQISALASSRNVLLLSGESGVGKTPVIREIKALAEVTGGTVIKSECYAEENAPYEPIAQIIRQALPILTLEPQTAKVIEGIQFPPPSEPLPEMILSSLTTIAPDLYLQYPKITHNPTLDPIAEQRRLFESVVAMSEELTKKAPALFIIEDVQWADHGTISLIRHLARRSRASRLPLMLLLTYREEELDQNHPVNDLVLDLNREQLAARIKLSRYNREQTRQFINAMFQDSITPEFLDAIYRETQGNMFFVEEVCKALIEEGTLYRTNGNWHWPDDVTTLNIPQNVRLAIQSRISNLSQDTQDVLLVAGLIGREFEYEVLLRACTKDDETLIDALESSVRAQIIEEVKRNSADVFLFTHGITMTTLQGSISGIRKRRIHARIAEAIKEIHPKEYATLAFHYAQANDEQNAASYYLLAGQNASQMYANRDAIRYYSKAIELIDENDPQLFSLYSARAQIYDITAQRDLQREDVESMLRIAEAIGDQGHYIDALIAQTDLYLETDHLLAREPVEKAIELARQINDPVREGLALRRLGYDARNQCELNLSRTALESAIEKFQAANLLDEAAISFHILSLTLSDLGKHAEAIRAAEKALEFSRQSGNRLQEGTSLRRLAIAHMPTLEHEKALPYALEALDLHRDIGDRSEECHALNVIGLLMTWVGTPQEAESYLRQSLEVAEEIGANQSINFVTENLIWNHYWRNGLFEEGLLFLDKQLSKPIIRNNEYLGNTTIILKAEILGTIGQYERAHQLAESVKAYFQNSPNQLVVSKFMGQLGRLYAEMGEYERSEQALSESLRLAESLGNQIYIAIINTNRAFLLYDKGGSENLQEGLKLTESAAPYLKGTEKIFDLCNALTVAALIHLELGQADQALIKSSQAIKLTKDWPFVREDYLFIHSRALRKNNQAEEANQYLEQAYERVMLVANNLQDPDLRKGWFENVRISRGILADWQEYMS